MSEGRPLLSIVLPVRDQADHVARVVDSYHAELARHGWTYELLLVVNACADDTLAVCRGLEARSGRARVVENPPGGWGRSVRVGLAQARGEYVCYTNSARTLPAQVTTLVELVRARGLVVGKVDRRARGDRTRALGSALYNLECRLLLGIEADDVNGTPKVFPRALLDRLRLVSDGDLVDAELLLRCRRLGVPVVSLPVEGWRRHGGRSSTNLRSAWRMYSGAVKLWWRDRGRPE